MLKNLPSVNVGSLVTGVLCLAVLIGLKQVNERFRDRLKIPIPAELLVVSNTGLLLGLDLFILFRSVSSKMILYLSFFSRLLLVLRFHTEQQSAKTLEYQF